jgi:hypothetical protein
MKNNNHKQAAADFILDADDQYEDEFDIDEEE